MGTDRTQEDPTARECLLKTIHPSSLSLGQHKGPCQLPLPCTEFRGGTEAFHERDDGSVSAEASDQAKERKPKALSS